MRFKKRGISIAVVLLLAVTVSAVGASRVHTYYLHRGPGLKFRIIGGVRTGRPVRVLEEKAGWVKIETSHGKIGWISQRTYHRGWRKKGRHLSREPVSVEIKFQNIPKECIPIMEKKLGELKKHLSPVGDNALELIVSSMPRLNSYRMFLVIDFNPSFYRHAMKRFNLPTTIDLLPYNGCIWALYAYKQALIRAVNKHLSMACTFVRRFTLSLILRRPDGEEVILETVEDGVYIYFSPFIIFRKPNGKVFRILSEEPKKVGLLSAFALPYPLERGDPSSARAYAVYRFFRARP
jgi:hypothetical protein